MLEKAAADADRPARLGRLEINVIAPPAGIAAGAVQQYEELGVDRLLLYPLPLEDPGDVAAFLERHAA